MFRFFVFFAFVQLGLLRQVGSRKNALYIAAFLPTSKGGPWEAIGSDVACEIAIDDVNSTPTLLKDYELRLRTNDTKCSRGRAGYQLYDQLNEEEKFVALVGAGCTPVTEVVSEITTYVHLIQLGFLSTSPVLLDRTKFPFYYQVNPSANGQNLLRSSLMKEFKWSHAVILFEESFRLNAQDLANRFNASNVKHKMYYVSGDSFGFNVEEVMQHVKDLDYRIIFALVFEPVARKIVCQAFRVGLTSTLYVWVFPGWYDYSPQDEWFLHTTSDSFNLTCSVDEMKKTINGHFTTDLTRLSVPEDLSVLPNKTYAHFQREYIRRTGDDSFQYYAAYGYDAIVAVAHMLDKALRRYPDLFVNLNYENATLASVLNETLIHNVSFRGFTGHVQFENLSRSAVESDYFDRAWIYYRIYDKDILSTYEVRANEKRDSYENWTWPTADGQTPVSSPPNMTSFSNKGIFYTVATIDAIAVILTVVLLIFTFYHREKKLIRLSSPRLNYLIGLGVLLILVAVILNGFNGQFFKFDDNSLHSCSARNALLIFGFSFAFGSMFAKAWRVNVIFKRSKAGSSSDVKLTDHVLFAIVGALLLIDVVLLTVWYTLDPYQKTTQTLRTDSRETYIWEKCYSDHANRWSYVVLAYKAVVLVAGAFLAFETRTVHIPSLNDSRYIALSIYNTVVACILAFAFTFIEDPGISFALTGVAVIVMTTIIVSLVFIPKVYLLFFAKNKSVAEMGPARKRTKASLSAFTFAKKADLRRLQDENRRQKLAMEIMIRERNLSESTIQRMTQNFGLADTILEEDSGVVEASLENTTTRTDTTRTDTTAVESESAA